jgi:hypothetical protein
VEYFYKYGTAVYINSRNFEFSRSPPEGREMQDVAHFTATRLVRAGIL